MLKYLFLLLAAFWLIPRLMRWLLLPASASRRGNDARRKSARRPDPGRPEDGRPESSERLRDLTQQDISDADYEEIPPEE
jgi:hypothetical protein